MWFGSMEKRTVKKLKRNVLRCDHCKHALAAADPWIYEILRKKTFCERCGEVILKEVEADGPIAGLLRISIL